MKKFVRIFTIFCQKNNLSSYKTAILKFISKDMIKLIIIVLKTSLETIE